jgi:transcriptional regulator with XRE-family HTH domain
LDQVHTDPRASDALDRALGNTIRLRRRSLSITQEQLANACGISFQQVQKYEHGATRVSFSRLVRIASALNCQVTDLTNSLDQPQTSAADFEFIRLMTVPGAVDLLKRYSALSSGSRAKLVGFLASVGKP